MTELEPSKVGALGLDHPVGHFQGQQAKNPTKLGCSDKVPKFGCSDEVP